MREQKEVILLIEDNPLLTDAYKAAFENKGFTVLNANAGEVGLEYATKMHPDLVLLDLRIHGLQGIEVLRQLKTAPETSAMHVIVFTMSAEDADREQALALGADGFLRKSEVNLASLITRVEDVLHN